MDAEADLDRKVNTFKEACERYPNEAQFQQSLKLTRERRDLVQSIVAKARHYEEKKTVHGSGRAVGYSAQHLSQYPGSKSRSGSS